MPYNNDKESSSGTIYPTIEKISILNSESNWIIAILLVNMSCDHEELSLQYTQQLPFITFPFSVNVAEWRQAILI